MNSSVLFLILLQNLAYLLRISTISNRFATLTFDQIWLMRNEIKHHPRTHIDPVELSKTILCLTKEYMQACMILYISSNVSSLLCRYLCPFCRSQVSIWCAVREKFSVAATICLDPSNSILVARTEFHYDVTDLLKVEALAAQMASTMHPSCATLEGDSSIFIAALRQEGSDIDWSILNTISNPIFYLSSISSWTARKITRVENSRAHRLAQWAMTTHFSDHIPSSLFHSIWQYEVTDPPWTVLSLVCIFFI